MCNYSSGNRFLQQFSVVLSYAFNERNIILWMWLLSPATRRYNKSDQRKIASLDSTARFQAYIVLIYFTRVWSWSDDIMMKVAKKIEVGIKWHQTYCKYMDYLTTICISNNTTYRHRYRCQNTNTMKSSDPDLEERPMIKREYYKVNLIFLKKILSINHDCYKKRF